MACSLGDADGDERIEQWGQALRGLVTRAERSRAGQLRLTLADEPDRVATLLAIARAEKVCCPFFDFSLLVGTPDVLVIDVPAGSEVVLDDFARLVPGD